MKPRNYRCFVSLAAAAAVFLLCAASLVAQEVTDTVHTDTVPTDTVASLPPPPAKADTILFIPRDNEAAAAEVASPVDLEKHLTQPPTLALFKSMFVPGLGQVGNRRYFKAALFAGLEGWMLIKALDLGSQAGDAREIYQANPSYSTYTAYDTKRKSRNKYAWFCGLTVFISMFDAYVDAHLSGSPAEPRNQKFTVDVVPSGSDGAQASISYSF